VRPLAADLATRLAADLATPLAANLAANLATGPRSRQRLPGVGLKQQAELLLQLVA